MRQRLGRFFGLGLAKRGQFRVNNARIFAGLGEKQVEFALPMPKQNHDSHPCLIGICLARLLHRRNQPCFWAISATLG
jgi:hypothetical protein